MLIITHSPDSDDKIQLTEILGDNLMVWFRREKDKLRQLYSLNFFDGIPFHGDRANIAVSSSEVGNFSFSSTEEEVSFPLSFREMMMTELGRVFGSFPNLSAMIKELPEILDRYEKEMNTEKLQIALDSCK